jgi:hypothetical protein
VAASRAADPRYFDFDAALAEAEETPIPFKLMGKVWDVPGSVDAAVILRIQRLMLILAEYENSGEVPDDLVIDENLSYEAMCRQMIGDDLMETWLAHQWRDASGRKRTGPSYEMLQAVSRRLFAIHTGSDPDEEPDEAGKAKRPADRKPPAKKSSARRRSSTTGR